jgi:hypothetical protein
MRDQTRIRTAGFVSIANKHFHVIGELCRDHKIPVAGVSLWADDVPQAFVLPD